MTAKNGELKASSKVEGVEKKKRTNTRTRAKKTVEKPEQNEKDQDIIIDNQYEKMNIDQDLPVYLL